MFHHLQYKLRRVNQLKNFWLLSTQSLRFTRDDPKSHVALSLLPQKIFFQVTVTSYFSYMQDSGATEVFIPIWLSRGGIDWLNKDWYTVRYMFYHLTLLKL